MVSKSKESGDDDQYLQTGKRDIKALVRLWCQHEISFFVETLEVYAKKLIETYLKTVGNGFRPSNEREMMAEVFRPGVEDQVLEVPGRLTQLELCDRYWKKMFRVYHANLTAKGITKDSKVLEREALSFYQKLALRTLYPEEWKQDANVQHCDFVGIGLTLQDGKGFIYDTLGDYFVASYFFEKLQQPDHEGFEDFFFSHVFEDDENIVAEFLGALIMQHSIEPNVHITEKHVQHCVKYLHNLEDAVTEENSEQLGILLFLYRCIKKHVEEYPVEERRNRMKKYIDDWLIGHYIQCAAADENVVALEALLNIGIAEDMNLEGVIKHLFYNDDFCSLIVKPALLKATEKMFGYLIKKDMDVSLLLRPTRDSSLLGEAVQKKNAKLVDWILEFAVKNELDSDTILSFDDVCNSPLHIAAKMGSEDIFNEILAYVKDRATNRKALLTPNEAGRGLLHQAALGRNENIVKNIVQFSIDNEMDPILFFNPDKNGSSPFHLAASLPKSSNVNDERSKCDAVVDGMFAIADEMKINVIQALAQDQCGMNPVYLAARSGLATVIEIIFEHAKKCGLDSSKLFVRNQNGQTPLHTAAEEGHVQVVETLLTLISETRSNASKLMKADDDGETPLSYAVYGGHRAVAEVILDFALRQNISLKTLLSGFGDDLDPPARRRLSRCTDVNGMVKILFSRIKARQLEEKY